MVFIWFHFRKENEIKKKLKNENKIKTNDKKNKMNEIRQWKDKTKITIENKQNIKIKKLKKEIICTVVSTFKQELVLLLELCLTRYF